MIRLHEPSMLLFAASVVVPLLIAARSASRSVRRPWAAVEILAQAVRRTAAGRRAVDWFFVLIRAGMLALVALAAARPFMPAGAPGLAPAATRMAARREVLHAVAGPAAEADSKMIPLRSALRAIAGESLAHRVVGMAELPRQPFDAEALVVLADGAVPDRAAARGLAAFVDRGGSIAVLVGPASTGGPSRESLSRWLSDLAGVAIRGVEDCESCGLRMASPGTEDQEAAWDGPTVFRRALLDTRSPRPGAAVPETSPTVLLRTTPAGEPLAVAVRRGRGIVAVFAIPLTLPGIDGSRWAAGDEPRSWSDVAARPAFLPLVERTILPLARAAEPQEAAGLTASDSLREWLLRTNLAGLLLTVVLGLAVLDPLAAAAVRRSRRGP